jgi:competence protein ComEC
VAPLANALVLPLLPVMMVIGGGGTLLAVVAPPAAFPLLQAAAAVASWFRLVIGLTSSLPAAALAMPYFPARWLTAACLLNAGLLGGLAFRSYLFKMRWLALPLGAALLSVVLLLLGPDGKVHVYALDVGTGSAVLVRTGTGEQLLIDGGQDPNLLAQALGRALPPTARQINDWLITGGRLAQIGAAPAVLQRYRVDRMLVDDPDPWTPSLRNLVDAAQADGVPVATATGLTLDGVLLTTGSDGRTLVLQSGSAVLLVMAPDSEVAGEAVPIIFTSGGPPDWADAPPPLAVIEVARNSRAGLPARDLLLGLNGAKILRTDQVGSVELVPSAQGFEPVYN